MIKMLCDLYDTPSVFTIPIPIPIPYPTFFRLLVVSSIILPDYLSWIRGIRSSVLP